MKYKLKDILLVIIFFSILLITFFVNIITEDELISVSERIRYGLPIEDSDRIVLLKNLIATKSTTYK